MELSRIIQKLTAPLSRRVRLMVRRAVVKLVYDDLKMQELQLAIFSGEIRDNVERWEDYGLTSHPHPGAEALVLALGGNSDHSAVVKVGDRRFRFTGLAEGEVVLYDDQKQAIHFKRDKQIHIYGTDKLTADVATETTVTCPLVKVVAGTKVILDTPRLEVTGAITAGLDVTDNTIGGGSTMAAIRDAHNQHRHQENGDGGGITDTPTTTI